jgi:heat shock protein HslJ
MDLGVNACRHIVLLAVSVGLAAGLAGCSSPTNEDTRSATAGMPNLEQSLAAQHWRLDRRDSSVAHEFDRVVTLEFHADGTVSGRAPCNDYRASYTTDLDDWTVTVSRLAATTKRSCSGSTTRAEREYLHALTTVRDVEFSDGYFHVVLDNSTGDRLSYDAFDTP